MKVLLIAISLFWTLTGPAHASEKTQAALWDAIKSGEHVVLMRHALAPGTGDPDDFDLDDCGTQRNLSNEGRAQAKRIGARFQAAGIASARVYSSQWCRCVETAELLNLGPIEELQSLNSFFRRPERRAATTEALKDWLAGQPLDRPLILVTHQVNITALTGVYPRSGEMIVIKRSKDGAFTVAGRMETE